MSARDREAWNQVSEEFDKKIGDEGDEVRRNCVDPMLLDALKNHCAAASRVLDAGSGNGHLVKKLRIAGYGVAGLDISQSLIRIAQRRCPGIPFHEADLEVPASLPSETWDAVVCSFVLDGLEHLDDALRSLGKLTKASGNLLVNLPHPAFLPPEYWGLRSQKLYVEDDLLGLDIVLQRCTVPLKYFSRPLSRYVNALISAGFTICSLVEPDPRSLDGYFHRTGRPLLNAYVLGIIARRNP